MNFVRVIIWKELKQIKADPLMVRLMIFPVFLQMFVLGYAITTEVKNTTLTIVDKSNTPQSASLARHFQHNGLFICVGPSSTETEAREKIDDGKARMALVIPADFTKTLDRGDGATVGLLVDGQDANSSTVAAGYVNAVIMDWNTDYLRTTLGARGLRIETMLPVEPRPVILFNPMLKSTWYMVPGLAVVLVTIVTALLTGLSIVKEKESGTLEQLMVTPISAVHVVLGKTAPLIIIGLVELCAGPFDRHAVVRHTV